MKRLALCSTALLLCACSGATTDDAGGDALRADSTAASIDLADLDQSLLRDEPVMFRVSDSDSEMILFGTFHILPPEVEWRSDALSDAVTRADEVWFELPAGAQDDPALPQVTMALGLSETPLSERLDPDMFARLEAQAAAIGIPVEMLDPMQPWLAAITLPVMQMIGAGFDPAAGAESVLEGMVAGKPRQAFETAEQQLRFFADMDEKAQIDMLDMTLDGMDDGTDLIVRMADSWAGGDVDMLEDEVVAETARLAPALYEVMFVQRNAAWTERLAREMDGAGTDFVAVGAGHLLGPDSVPVMLADRGYDVQVLTLRDVPE